MYLGFIGLSSKVHCSWIGSGEEEFTWGKRKRTLNVNYSAKTQLVSMILDQEMTRHFPVINKTTP